MLNLLVIRATNLERSKAFYELIGLNFERHQHSNGSPHLASVQNGIIFEIYPTLGKDTADTRFGFLVTGLDQIVSHLLAHDGVVLSPPKSSQWGRRAVIKDPDGHTVELLEHNI